MGSKGCRVGLGLLFFVIGTLAGPVIPNNSGSSSCSIHQCNPSGHDKFRYEIGTTYVYAFSSSLQTFVLAENGVRSELQLTATAHIHVHSACEFILKLTDVDIKDQTSQDGESSTFEELKQLVENDVVKFSFQDGTIDLICSPAETPTWALNIKKGIISMLQNTAPDMEYEGIINEVDINGRCPTQYSFGTEGWGASTNIVKSKDLSACLQRKHHLSAIQSVPYTPSQPTTLFSGRVECTQTILQNKVERVECQEEQIFQPFEHNESGARNMVVQSLRFVRSNRDGFRTTVGDVMSFTRESLMFEIDVRGDSSSNDLTRPIALVKELQLKSTPNIQAEAAYLFKQLLESLRALDEASLRSLLGTTTVSNEVLLDALRWVNTGPSLTIMTQLYLAERLDKDLASSWLSNVAFIKHPTAEMVSAMLPLLDRNPDTDVLLSTSALMNSYCRDNNGCTRDKLILQAILKISQTLGHSCDQSQTTAGKYRVIASLKALGNLGVAEHEVIIMLEKCLQSKTNPIDVRLAAIDAHRRMPCSSFPLDPFLRIYADYTEDTEVRIQSYLAAMKSVNRRVLDVVEKVMEDEVVNQVGSFVWTHLTNLQETNRRDREGIRKLVSNEQLQNKFQTDARKFSRNYESSYFSDTYNAGAGFDANVIFTEDSFLPKSVTTNFSIQILGEHINLFEIGGRFTSPESLLEPIFGPKGYFPDESMSTFLQSARQKRDTSSNLERLNTIRDTAIQHNNEGPPSSAIYTRVFGHEVMYKELEVTREATIPNIVDEKGHKWFSMRRILDNLGTGKTTQFTRSNVIMDLEYSVPTMAGIPLTLTLEAGSTIALDAEMRLSMSGFMQQKKELEAYARLRPNLVLNVDASLTVTIGSQSNKIRSGLAVRNVLRSSSGIETHLEVQGPNGVKMTVNLPQAKQDLLEVSSKVVFLRASGSDTVLTASQGEQKFQWNTCLGNKEANFLGLELCGQLSLPKGFTLTPLEPLYAYFYLERSDDFTGYTLQYTKERTSSRAKMKFTFDTPGSKLDRQTQLSFEKLGPGSFRASVKTLGIVIDGHGKYTEALRGLDLVFIDNGHQVFLMNTSLTQSPGRFRPYFYVAVLKRPITEVEGVVEIDSAPGQTKRAKTELTLKYVATNPIKLQGTFTATDDNSEASLGLGLESYYITGTLTSQVKKRPHYWNSKSLLEYSWKQGEISTVDIMTKLQKAQTGALLKYGAAASLIISKFPDHSIDFSSEVAVSPGFCETVAKLTVGKSTWNGHTLYSFQDTHDLTDFRIILMLKNPTQDVDFHIEFVHTVLDRSFSTKFIGRTKPRNEVRARIAYNAQTKPLLSNNLTMELIWPENEYQLQTFVMEKRKGEFDGELLIVLSNYHEMKATVSYMNKSNNLKLDHSLDFRARGFSSVPISGNLGFSLTDKRSHIGCQVLLEGRKPYSSRLSTSIDYSQVRNKHKIEAKVTFNDNKYSSELIFIQRKTGEKHVTVDLFVGQHVFIEGKLNGSLPIGTWASIMIIPDKDNLPHEKVQAVGSLSSRDVSLIFNYFGTKVSASGIINLDGATGKVTWNENKRISASVKCTELSLPSSSIGIELSTPFDTFKVFNLDWSHKIEDANATAKLSGRIEDRSLLMQIQSVADGNKGNLVGIVDITGYKRHELQGSWEKDPDHQNLKIYMLRGHHETSLHYDLRYGWSYSVFNFELRGTASIPEIQLMWNRERHEAQSTQLKLEWGYPNQDKNGLEFTISNTLNPARYEFFMKTPFASLNSASGSAVLDSKSSTYAITVRTGGAWKVLPIELDVKLEGTCSTSLNHSVIVRSASATMGGSMSGYVRSWDDIKLDGLTTANSKQYRIHLMTGSEGGSRIIQLMADAGSEKTGFGLVLKDDGSMNKSELTAWDSYLIGSTEKTATISFEKDRAFRNFTMLIKGNSRDLLKVDADFITTGWMFWSISCNISSWTSFVPSIIFHSTHDMIHLSNISSTNRLNIEPMDNSFWDKSGLRLRAFSHLVISNFERFHVALDWGTFDINIDGQRQDKVTTFEVSSSMFPNVHGRVKYDLKDKGFDVSTKILQSGFVIISGSVRVSKSSELFKIGGSFESLATPEFEGAFELHRQTGRIDSFLTSNGDDVFRIEAQGQAGPARAFLTWKSQSMFYPSIDNVIFDAMYTLEINGSLQFHANYSDKAMSHGIKGVGCWGQDKFLHLTTVGDIVAGIELTLQEMKKLFVVVTLEGRKLWEAHTTYEATPSNFAWGHHMMSIVVFNHRQESTIISLSAGIDPRRFDGVLITPFKSWSKTRMYWNMDTQLIEKHISFGIHKESDKLDCALDMMHLKKNDTTIVGAEINVVGFKSIRDALFDQENLETLKAIEGTFSASAKWSSSSIEVHLNTPIERWQELKFAGVYENRRNLKSIVVTCDTNGLHHELRTSMRSKNETIDVDFQVQCRKSYKGKLSMDSVNKKGELLLQGPNQKWTVNGHFKDDEMELKAVTPIKDYERLFVTAGYRYNSSLEHRGHLQWIINGDAKEVSFEFLKTEDSCKLQLATPIPDYESVLIFSTYDAEFRSINLLIRAPNDQEIIVDVRTNVTRILSNLFADASLNLDIHVVSPFENYKTIAFRTDYHRINGEHNADVQYSRNNDLLQLNGHFLYNHQIPHALNIEISVNSLNNYSSKVRGTLSIDPNGNSSFASVVEYNEAKYEVGAVLNLSQTGRHFSLQTTLPFLKLLQLSLENDAGNSLHGRWEGNNKVLDVRTNSSSEETARQRIEVAIESPFAGFTHILLHADCKVESNGLKSSFFFENEESRWQGKLEGSIDEYNGDWKAQVNTPINGYQEISVSLNHVWNEVVKSMQIFVYTNSLKCVGLEASLKESQIHFGFQTEILGKIEIQGSFKWGSNSTVLEARTGIAGICSLDMNIRGFTALVLSFENLSDRDHSFILAYNIDGALKDGSAWASLTNKALLNPSFHTTWKFEDWKQGKVEVWVKSNHSNEEKGGVLQWTVSKQPSSRESRANFHCSWKLGTETDLIAITAKQHQQFGSSSSVIEIESESTLKPFHAFRMKVSLSSQNELYVSIDASKDNTNIVVVEGKFLITLPTSSLFLNLNAPMFSKVMLSASYHMSGEKKTFDITYNEDSSIASLRTIIFIHQNKPEIELSFDFTSNVTDANLRLDGLVKGNYYRTEDGLKRLALSLVSQRLGNWNFSSEIRPLDNFYARVQLDSLNHNTVDGLSLNAHWKGSLAQRISGGVFLSIKGTNIINGTLSVTRDKVQFGLHCPSLGIERTSVVGTLDDVDKQSTFSVKATFGSTSYSFNGTCDFEHWKTLQVRGSVTCAKVDQVVGSLNLESDGNGNLSLRGFWDGQAILIKGRLTRVGETDFIQASRASLTLALNGVETITIKMEHRFQPGDFFLNVSVADDKSVRFSLVQHPDSYIIGISLQLDHSARMKFMLMIEPEQFDVSFTSPWMPEVAAQGVLRINSSHKAMQGFLIYNTQKSSALLQTISNNDTVQFELSLEVPSLHQKLLMTLHVHSPNVHQSGGELELNLNGSKFGISGEVVSRVEGGKHQSSKLTLNLKLPKIVATEIYIKRPLYESSSLIVNGSLTMGSEEPSTVHFSYDIPWNGKQVLGLNFLLTSVDSKYGIHAVSSCNCWKDFNASVTYNDNHVALGWKMNLPQVSSYLQIIRENEDVWFIRNYKLQIIGYLEPRKTYIMSFATVCNDRVLNAYLAADIGGYELLLDAAVNSTYFRALEDHRYVAKFTKIRTGYYEYELSGKQGVSEVTITGDVSISAYNVTGNAKMSGLWGSLYARMEYSKQPNDGHVLWLILESPTLIAGKKVTVRGQLASPQQHGVFLSLQCRTRSSVHSTSLKLLKDTGHGEMDFVLNSPNLEPVALQLLWDNQGSKYKGEIHTNLNNIVNDLVAFVDTSNLEGRVTIISPLIPSSHFEVHLKAVFNPDAIDVLGDINIRDYHWKFEGALKYQSWRDLVAVLNLVTPHQSFDRLTLAMKSMDDEIYGEIYTPIAAVPNAMIKVSGFQAILHKNWNDFHLEVSIALPVGKYIASAEYKIPDLDSKGKLRLYFTDGTVVYELGGEISPLSQFDSNMYENCHIAFLMTTPFEEIPNIDFKAEGLVRGRNKVFVTARGKVDEENVQVEFDYVNGHENPTIRAKLTSPFELYENVAFSLSFDNFQKIGNGVSVHMEVENPQWMDKITLDADYHYKYAGFLTFDGEANAVIVSFMDIPPIHLTIKTSSETGFNGTAAAHVGDSLYSVHVNAQFSEEELGVHLNATACNEDPYNLIVTSNILRHDKHFQFFAEITAMSDEILRTTLVFSPELDQSGGEFKIETPWGPLRFGVMLMPISLVLRTSEFSIWRILRNTNASMDLSFDNQRLIGIQAAVNGNGGVFELFNPIAPINLILQLQKIASSEFIVVGSFCWDINDPVGKTVGMRLNWRKSDIGGYAGALKMEMEEAGIVTLRLCNAVTSTMLNQTVSIVWNSPMFESIGESGYLLVISNDPFLHKKQAIIQIHLPWRSLEFEALANNHDDTSLTSALFTWDLLRNPNKLIGLKWHQQVKAGWRAIEILDVIEIMHPLSGIPNTLSSDRIYKNGLFQMMELELSGQDIFHSPLVFSVIRNNTEWCNSVLSLRHEPTNLMIAVTNTANEEVMLSHFSYMDVNGSLKNVSLQLITKANHLELLLTNIEYDLFGMRSHWFPDLVTFNAKLLSYDMDSMMQMTLPFIQVIFKHNGEDRMSMFAGYSNRRKFGTHLSRVESEQLIPIFKAVTELTLNHALETRLIWTTDWSPLLDMSVPNKVFSSISENIRNLGIFSFVSSEASARWERLSPEMQIAFMSTKDFVVSEVISVYGEVEWIIQQLSQMYENNKFYMKDVIDAFGFVHDTWRTIRAALTDAWITATDRFSYILMRFSTLYGSFGGDFERLMISLWDETKLVIESSWEAYLHVISSFTRKIWSASKFLQDFLQTKISELEEKLMSIGLIRKFVQICRDYAVWFEEIPYRKMSHTIEAVVNFRLWDYIKDYLNPLLKVIRKAMQDEYIQELLQTQPIPFISYTASFLHGAAVRLWDALEVEQRLKTLARTALYSFNQNMHQYLPIASYVVDLDGGVIEYNQSLSGIQWTDFTQLPTWGIINDIRDVNRLANFYYEVSETIESLKPIINLNIRRLLPPFGSYALMAGDHHYVTFDKRYFRFEGECSYLLVADLFHTVDPFYLVANYENRNGFIRKKSYALTSNGSGIEIDINDFKVTLNGKKVELPLQIGSVYIRRHQTGLEVFDERGFTMTCSLSPSVCTVGISGWYFGKIAGLLGTYDNEPTNDLQNPSGQPMSDISSFAFSWRVGDNSATCRMKNFVKHEVTILDVDGICHNLLKNNSSPLRPCFNTVDTTVFVEMCQYDVLRNINSANRDSAACTAFNAYVTECHKNNVDVWMPPACVRCKLEDGTTLTTGENATLQTQGVRKAPKSSDNVILLDDSCRISPSMLSEAMKRLDLALKNIGLANNRYTIIGFGGAGAHSQPHIETMASNVWSHNTLFKIPNDTTIMGAIPFNKPQLYDGIQYAAALSFRAGVSKNFIAVTCGNETCGDSTRYADILTLLVENDIKLHLLVPKEFTFKGSRKDELTLIYGLDMNGVYTAKHTKSGILEADSDLKRHINVPKDYCTPLALESNGTLFNIENATKKVLDVWSRRVAQTSHPSECQRCECIPDRFGSGSVMCHQCVSPTLWKFIEEWKSYQSLDGEEFPGLEFFDHGDFLLT